MVVASPSAAGVGRGRPAAHTGRPPAGADRREEKLGGRINESRGLDDGRYQVPALTS